MPNVPPLNATGRSGAKVAERILTRRVTMRPRAGEPRAMSQHPCKVPISQESAA